MTKPEADPVRAYFAAVRKQYLEAYRRAIEEAKVEAGKSGRKVLIEAAASVEAGGAGGEGSNDLPYRLDVVSLGKDGSVQPTTVSVEALPCEPADLQAGDFLADVESFVWNVCVIIGRPAPEAAQLEQLREWFLRWFQREGGGGEKPFGGLVHFMSEPSVAEDVIQVQVDLGSAPVDALMDLLEVFGKMGAKEGLVFTPTASAEA
jgi:hypothetical protein